MTTVTITHSIARSFIAPIFVAGGLDAIRDPDEKAKKADQVIGRIASTLGLPDDPVKLVRVNGGVQLAAGSMLALGWAPRLSAGVLAASLVPTTIAGHRFWQEPDPQLKAAQRTELMKNLAMLGGLMLAATDYDGRPSLTWRAKRSATRAKRSATRAAGRATSAVSSATDLVSGHSHAAAGLGHSAAGLGEKALAVAAVLGERAVHLAGAAGHVAETAGERAAQVVGAAGRGVESNGPRVLHAVGKAASQAASSAADVASHAADAVSERAASLAR